MRIKQGNTYDVSLALTFNDGTGTAPDNVAKIEVSLGRLKKNYPGDVVYDDENDMWTFHLTQEETLSLQGILKLSASVKGLTGDVGDCDIAIVVVGNSSRKEVL